MGTAVDIVNTLIQQREANNRAEQDRITGMFENARANRLKQQQLDLQRQEQVQDAPFNSLIKTGQAVDALTKQFEAGMISQQQFDSAITSLNQGSVQRNLAYVLNDPQASPASQPQVVPQAGQLAQTAQGQKTAVSNFTSPQAQQVDTSNMTPSERRQFAKQQETQQDLAKKQGEADIQAQKEIDVQTGKEEAKQRQGAEKGITGSVRFIQQFERSVKELQEKGFEGFGETGVEGKIQRAGLSFLNALDELPQTKTLITEAKVIANQTARDIEGGRVTDSDRQIYADALADTLARPSEANIQLTSNALVRMFDKGGDLTPVLEAFGDSDTEIINQIVFKTLEGIGEKGRKSLLGSKE